MKAQLAHVESAHPAILAAMKSASGMDAAVTAKLKELPGAAELMSSVMTFAGRVSEAVSEVASATHPAGGYAVGGEGTPIDEAKLKSGLAKLRSALPMGAIVDQVEKLLTHKDTAAKIKEKLGGQADLAPVREALKKVHPSTVASFKNLSEALKAIQQHEQVAATPQLKASLSHLETELSTIMAAFGKDLERLVGVCDKWVGSLQ